MESSIAIPKKLFEKVLFELSIEHGLYATDNPKTGEYYALNHKQLIKELDEEASPICSDDVDTGRLLAKSYKLLDDLVTILRMTDDMEYVGIDESYDEFLEELENALK